MLQTGIMAFLKEMNSIPLTPNRTKLSVIKVPEKGMVNNMARKTGGKRQIDILDTFLAYQAACNTWLLATYNHL
ncbi:MAG: hypothetical protein CSA52_03635 [Gammaproteobacteria bacterium]|nr:MAG: hypothetical protein CSB48_06040 [Pseudomonadota bacterium]PIE38117.1 MAG: hypothetical protein CSA52_03635 [Gammaproteobacteria bacterium]